MDRIPVHNYAAFIPGARKPYRVAVDDKGEEIGISLAGYLTTWEQVNANGQRWQSAAYDECVKTYFEGGGINIPLDLMHQRDFCSLAGIVRKITKNAKGLLIEALVSKAAVHYNSIVGLLDTGVLQGFSNYGWLTDYDLDGDTLVVKSFALVSASLVDTPADLGSKFIANSTRFDGFGLNEEEDAPEDKPQTGRQLNCYGLWV